MKPSALSWALAVAAFAFVHLLAAVVVWLSWSSFWSWWSEASDGTRAGAVVGICAAGLVMDMISFAAAGLVAFLSFRIGARNRANSHRLSVL